MHWAGLKIQPGEIKGVLYKIKRKKWQQVKKEVIAAIWAAIVYHIWRTRNWKIFRSVNVNAESIVTQMKKEIVDKVDLFKQSRKGQRCNVLFQRLLCN